MERPIDVTRIPSIVTMSIGGTVSRMVRTDGTRT